jgi:hypothetical protein
MSDFSFGGVTLPEGAKRLAMATRAFSPRDFRMSALSTTPTPQASTDKSA